MPPVIDISQEFLTSSSLYEEESLQAGAKPSKLPHSSTPSNNISDINVSPMEYRRFEMVSRSHVQTITTTLTTRTANANHTTFTSSVYCLPWYITSLLPSNAQPVTLGDALRQGAFNTTDQIVYDSNLNSWLPLDVAVSRGLLSEMAQKRLQTPLKGCRPEVSPLEALAKGVLDAERRRWRESLTGRALTLDAALHDGALTVAAHGLLAELLTAGGGAEESADQVVHLQAHYGRASLADIGLRFTITDSVDLGVYEAQSGRFLEPVSGESLTYTEAMQRGLIRTDTREFQPPSGSNRMSVAEAISSDLFDADRGRLGGEDLVRGAQGRIIVQTAMSGRCVDRRQIGRKGSFAAKRWLSAKSA